MVRTRVAEKKKGGGGGGENGGGKKDDLLDQEVHKAIQKELALLKKQLTLEVNEFSSNWADKKCLICSKWYVIAASARQYGEASEIGDCHSQNEYIRSQGNDRPRFREWMKRLIMDRRRHGNITWILQWNCSQTKNLSLFSQWTSFNSMVLDYRQKTEFISSRKTCADLRYLVSDVFGILLSSHRIPVQI